MAEIVGENTANAANTGNTAATPTDPLRRRDGRLSRLGFLALGVVCVAVFVTALDQTVVVTALYAMTLDVGVPITQPDRVAWIVSGYLLGYVIAMPLMGRISDVFGRRRISREATCRRATCREAT